MLNANKLINITCMRSEMTLKQPRPGKSFATIIAFAVSGLAYFRGCRLRSSYGPTVPYPNLINLISSIIYLAHWFLIIPLVTLRMAIMPKTLFWAKTVHKGD